jgi:hypothetical protein
VTRVLAGPQALANFICEGLEKRFIEDRNPLYAWDAYQIARQAKVPVPDWVAVYLDACAQKLAAAIEPHVALGLSTKGGHSKVAQKRSRDRDVGVFSRVEFLMGITPEDMSDPPETYRRLLDKKGLRGESRAERIFAHVARETAMRGHRYPGVKKPLSAKTVAAIYYRLKKR